jgi:predicted Zn-dependent protease
MDKWVEAMTLGEQGERKRSPSQLLKRGYSAEEIKNLYELARQFLHIGQIRKAETLFSGITEIAPDFVYAWLGLSYVHICNKQLNEAIFSARQVLRIEPANIEALLYLSACLLTTGDHGAAGTYLGELKERIEQGSITKPEHIRFFKAQLVRYQGKAV